MKTQSLWGLCYAAASMLVLLVGPPGDAAAADERVDFNRDIRPILSNTCYACHGPDENQRQTDFRLDEKASAFGELDSGELAIVPGKPLESVLYQRIASDDGDQRMPPADSNKQLTPQQIELFKRWIGQGAAWQEHWSFIRPRRPAVPTLSDQQPGGGSDATGNEIDRFIRARLKRAGLQPSPRADKTTLLRRLTFDLTGLPPTIAEIDAFLADQSSGAYERAVDRLLQSPHYGEHMTRFWLDAARYGDTHGLHLDNVRSLWLYRDWVIRAFNENMPFDRFTIEQLAGDLLPDATLDQQIATGFNRCNVTTSEGGSIAEEYRVRYAVDRVETTATVWMGLTLGCAVCHEHKFDPVSQQEFYQLFAYFANLSDKPMDGNALLPPPVVKVPTAAQSRQLAERRQEVAAIQNKIKAAVAKAKIDADSGLQEPAESQVVEVVWIEDALPPGAKPQGNSPWQFVSQQESPVFSGEKASKRTATGLSQHYFTGATPGLKIAAGDLLFAHVYLDPSNPPKSIMLQFNDGSWDHRAYWGANEIGFGRDNSPSRRSMGKLPPAGEWVRLEVRAEAVGLKPGSELNGWAFTQYDGTVYWDQAGIVKANAAPTHFASQEAWEAAEKAKKKSDLPKPILDIVKIQTERRTAPQNNRLRAYFIENGDSQSRAIFDPLHKQLTDAQARLKQADEAIPSTMVTLEKAADRLPVYLLTRGLYDKPDTSQELFAGVPASLPPLPEDAPANRLTLARWLVEASHPLTARVTVNRFWQQYFGTGIVKTTEDFGSQGEWPSHPALLDWLAVDFVESGWDVKRLQKLIVMSATYRQSSKVTAIHREKDAANRLLARGSRFRLDAEMVRDNALAVSGLLVATVGGDSVKPYQPEGLWKAVGYTNSNTANFKQDHGQALYRRSMYTFWKRTSPPPSMAAFDAPSREACTVRRARTNTPMQALVLMNDIQFVEAARHFAQRIMTEGGQTPESRIERAFRLATARRPDADETRICLDVYRAHLERFQNDQQAAAALVSVGESKRNDSLDVAELAAWTMVANLILNLDETLTKG